MRFALAAFLVVAGLRADDVSCSASLAKLSNDSADDRERAARVLYERCSRSILRQDPETAAKLRKAVESGSGAPAIVLLGEFRDEKTLLTLRSVSSVKPVKLHQWSAPVPAPLAAAVALAHAGHPEDLASAVETKDLAQREFLLDTLSEIEPGPAMRKLAVNALSDEREIAGGVPGGAPLRRRLCDRAVDDFVSRLKLEFRLTPTRRYSAEALAKARTAILQALPQ